MWQVTTHFAGGFASAAQSAAAASYAKKQDPRQ